MATAYPMGEQSVAYADGTPAGQKGQAKVRIEGTTDPQVYLVKLDKRQIGRVREVAGHWEAYGAFLFTIRGGVQRYSSKENAALALAKAYMGRIAERVEAGGKKYPWLNQASGQGTRG